MARPTRKTKKIPSLKIGQPAHPRPMPMGFVTRAAVPSAKEITNDGANACARVNNAAMAMARRLATPIRPGSRRPDGKMAGSVTSPTKNSPAPQPFPHAWSVTRRFAWPSTTCDALPGGLDPTRTKVSPMPRTSQPMGWRGRRATSPMPPRTNDQKTSAPPQSVLVMRNAPAATASRVAGRSTRAATCTLLPAASRAGRGSVACATMLGALRAVGRSAGTRRVQPSAGARMPRRRSPGVTKLGFARSP